LFLFSSSLPEQAHNSRKKKKRGKGKQQNKHCARQEKLTLRTNYGLKVPLNKQKQKQRKTTKTAHTKSGAGQCKSESAGSFADDSSIKLCHSTQVP